MFSFFISCISSAARVEVIGGTTGELRVGTFYDLKKGNSNCDYYLILPDTKDIYVGSEGLKKINKNIDFIYLTSNKRGNIKYFYLIVEKACSTLDILLDVGGNKVIDGKMVNKYRKLCMIYLTTQDRPSYQLKRQAGEFDYENTYVYYQRQMTDTQNRWFNKGVRSDSDSTNAQTAIFKIWRES